MNECTIKLGDLLNDKRTFYSGQDINVLTNADKTTRLGIFNIKAFLITRIEEDPFAPGVINLWTVEFETTAFGDGQVACFKLKRAMDAIARKRKEI